MNNTKIPDYVKSIDKLPKEHPFYGREKEFVKLMNDDLTKELPQNENISCKYCGETDYENHPISYIRDGRWICLACKEKAFDIILLPQTNQRGKE